MPDNQLYFKDAVRYGKIEDVKKYLKEDKTLDVEVKSSDEGLTALHYACRNGSRDIVELLLDHGADIEASSYHPYHTPLMLACKHGRYSTTKLLLDRGAKMTCPLYGDGGPLHEACIARHASIVKILLNHRCVVDAVSMNGDTPLHKVCSNSSNYKKYCIEELLFHGADITIKNANGKTPLDLVQYETTRSLIRHIYTERKKFPEQDLKNNSYNSEMSSTQKAEDAECAESTLERRLSLKFKTIIDRRCEELHNDMVASQREEMNKIVENMNQEASNQNKANKYEENLIGLFDNEEVANCISNSSTNVVVGHMTSKVSSIEVHSDSNEESSIESQRRCKELCNTIVGNQEEMNQSLQRLIIEKTDSKKNAAFDAERNAGEGEFEIL